MANLKGVEGAEKMNVSFDLHPIKNGWILKIYYPLENETHYFKTSKEALKTIEAILKECEV